LNLKYHIKPPQALAERQAVDNVAAADPHFVWLCAESILNHYADHLPLVETDEPGVWVNDRPN
tara:strand:+ start:851 stop:1039 length:189 start_codon:yes stop_codon:yes gene_type:complete